jgi:hypothetical protein
MKVLFFKGARRTTMKKTTALSRCVFAAVAFAALCLPCWAQGNLRTVLFVKVKIDQEDNWKASVKDYAALLKKAGSDRRYTVWESQSGPFEYAVVWYSEKFKDLGEDDPKMASSAADRTAVFARLNGETDSLETWVDEMQPDLAITSKEIPAFVRTGRSKVFPGKMDEVRSMFRDQIVPAVKKSGATDYGVAIARFGTPTNEVHSYIGLSGWGDIDGPIGAEKGMTPAEWKAFQTKLASVIESTEWTLWKYHPELSYIPSAAK